MNVSDVTIIVPVYCKLQEHLTWLDECLNSAMSQGCDVVAYDDGSDIDTKPVLSKYIKRYSYSTTNRGVSFARNECVKLVKTPLFIPLDCDDRIKSGAINKLVNAWNGVPIYPDVMKFGKINEPHYELLDFDCSLLDQYVGFTSVNVLQSIEQYKTIGGWNERIEFYEDGEYNSRLFAQFCAVRLPEPLIEYRIHDNNRTRKYRKQAAEYTVKILQEIRSLDMGCSGCGRRRSGPGNDPTITSNINRSSTKGAAPKGESVGVMIGDSWKTAPSEFDGKVLAIYVGGEGKGKHYYNGVERAYKLTYGDKVYADPRDVREPGNTGDARLLVRVINTAPPPAPVIVVEQKVEPKIEIKIEPPKQEVKIEEIQLSQYVPKERLNLPDIRNMTYDDVLAADERGDFDGVDLAAVISMEARGKNRKKVIEWLKKRVQSG